MDVHSLYQVNFNGTINQKLATYKAPVINIFQLSPDTLLIQINDGSIYVTDLKGTIKKLLLMIELKGKI
ncbi:hypothetical protein P344_05355 [Spiroplasma mirum ATCC 29335]|uniref:Uncharacterized protein n=1 Tax=Spiroplasma mirum ATCC 29335 TaxID=838561 RepID=W0GM09_9MOLU|nr:MULTISPECIES: hypothetical protein [Spiroplasma]AHF61290.1 hypothetical protein SMM_0900 [Spiroplasma mirum ATCC 29335]AHI58392.1 hypothetical protein P344_05355 [Spiroplasma mirum ATCC 29335]